MLVFLLKREKRLPDISINSFFPVNKNTLNLLFVLFTKLSVTLNKKNIKNIKNFIN